MTVFSNICKRIDEIEFYLLSCVEPVTLTHIYCVCMSVTANLGCSIYREVNIVSV